ncbi:hypothetical protein CC78DRAFT_523223 [Lojkania enalia]|uniref:Integral membrane protein TmpA n=1 Tax=Lojkania enalia TaxID=147567 RepID=A0A9P4K5G5_9PLEO|nr:hypothetical protein CC78DRAFT_523223 [Didymosphaeria enalia]
MSRSETGYGKEPSHFGEKKPYSSACTLSLTESASGLPGKQQARFLRHLRLTFFTIYRRTFTVIFLANAIGLLILLQKSTIRTIPLDGLATWASSNFLIAILFRQDFCVNCIFRTAWLVPWSIPVGIRGLIARVYTYGGIHSGAAIAGTMWFASFTVLWTLRYSPNGWYSCSMLTITLSILLLLILILIFAFPALRSRLHNTFELTHRFLGWTCILLFWTQVVLLTHQTAKSFSSPFVALLIRQPTFWNLSLMTAMLMFPWLRLRKWDFTAEKLSSHALRLYFVHRVHRFSCISLSTSPLREWHPFATFPSTDPQKPGGSLIISAAGDWTQDVISSNGARRTFWIKGAPKAGVLSLSCIFKRVVIVTTGSGIGPYLSSILDRPTGQFCRLVWSTRSPTLIFGGEIVEQVERADPDAVIIDTDTMGRPDLVTVAWKVWNETQAEAVFVLSNKVVTKKVVYGLESRGVRAYGPIWDS